MPKRRPVLVPTARLLARLLGLNVKTITRLTASGALPQKTPEGFDAGACLAAYVAHREAIIERASVHRRKVEAVDDRYRLAKAQLAEVELSRRLAEVVPSSEVKTAWTALTDLIRSEFATLPPGLVSRLMLERDPAVVQRIWLEAIDEKLRRLSQTTIEREEAPMVD